MSRSTVAFPPVYSDHRSNGPCTGPHTTAIRTLLDGLREKFCTDCAITVSRGTNFEADNEEVRLRANRQR